MQSGLQQRDAVGGRNNVEIPVEVQSQDRLAGPYVGCIMVGQK